VNFLKPLSWKQFYPAGNKCSVMFHIDRSNISREQEILIVMVQPIPSCVQISSYHVWSICGIEIRQRLCHE
jgi:hypothetical protein